MKLNQDQEHAFKLLRDWLSSDEPEFILSGYAGTGKTSLLAYAIKELELKPVICAPTAKAASVLRSKLSGVNLDIGTIHSFIYQPRGGGNAKIRALEAERASLNAADPKHKKLTSLIDKERRELIKGKLSFSLKDTDDMVDLVIVDESSMVTRQMSQDLASRAKKRLYVGDSAQLPPVGCAGFFHQREPDVLLQQVQRQAWDNPILRLATMIRNGDTPTHYDHPGCRIVQRRAADPEVYLTADQTIIGTNAGRHKFNRFCRERLHPGYAREYLLGPDEKVICKTNAVTTHSALVNGNLFRCADEQPVWRFNAASTTPVQEPMQEVMLELWPGDSDVWVNVPVFAGLLLQNYVAAVEKIDPSIMLSNQECFQMGYLHFDYGYAITVHSAQGSEWNNVVLCDDWEGNDRDRWLYTAVTRAKESLTWVV